MTYKPPILASLFLWRGLRLQNLPPGTLLPASGVCVFYDYSMPLDRHAAQATIWNFTGSKLGVHFRKTLISCAQSTLRLNETSSEAARSSFGYGATQKKIQYVKKAQQA